MAYTVTTGPFFPGTTADNGGGGVVWASPANAKVSDGVFATASLTASTTTSNFLKATNFGFNLPPTAVIDGIFVEAQVKGNPAITSSVQIVQGGSFAGTAKTPNLIWTGSEIWQAFGGSTDLWGLTWTVAQINASTFGFGIKAQATSTVTANLDAMRVTVYWHYAPASIMKRYIYKVYNSAGTFLGLLPTPQTDLNYSYEINTAGTQIQLDIPISADTAFQGVTTLIDETGANTLISESGSLPLTNEGAVPIISLGPSNSGALVENGNRVAVVEVSYWNPNGKTILLGEIERWEASFGGQGGGSGGSAMSDTSGDIVSILIYTDGQELDNYMVLENPTPDQSNTSTNSQFNVNSTITTFGYAVTPGDLSGVSRITLDLSEFVPGNSASVTVGLYASGVGISNLSRFAAGNVPDITATQIVNTRNASTYDFIFNYPFPSTFSGFYIFSISTTDQNGVSVFYTNASGTMLAPGGSITGTPYFITYGMGTATDPLYENIDPSNMVLSLIDGYGGHITTTPTSVVNTGIDLTYQFNTNTLFEGIQAALSIAPDGFYWYVDLGTDTLFFQKTHSTADITFTKGLHFDQITIIATIESIYNTTFFTGGTPAGATNNIFVDYADQTSVALYGQRLDRLSDNHVLDNETATLVAFGDVETNKDEQYQTTITIAGLAIDTTTLRVGQVAGFNGFGSFIDNLLMQIVRIDYTPEEVTLTLGLMPKRLHQAFEKVIRGLVALQTVDNPGAAS